MSALNYICTPVGDVSVELSDSWNSSNLSFLMSEIQKRNSTYLKGLNEIRYLNYLSTVAGMD